MKKLIPFVFLLTGFCGKAQLPYQVQWVGSCGYPNMALVDFETNQDTDHFYFDTQQSNNLWQFGKPQKTVFTSAYTGQRALVTDSTLPYPMGNRSSFSFKVILYCLHPEGTAIQFLNRFETDQNTDGGTIEISHDNGITWMNLVNDPLLHNQFQLYSPTSSIASLNNAPGFSGSSSGWQNVNFEVYATSYPTDTLVFKFTFASDSLNSNKDGWMIDRMFIAGIGESVPEYSNNDLISVFPNPAVTEIYFHSEKKFNQPFDLSIYNSIGQKIKEENNTSGKIDVSELKSGIYFVSFKNEDFYASKKITIQR